MQTEKQPVTGHFTPASAQRMPSYRKTGAASQTNGPCVLNRTLQFLEGCLMKKEMVKPEVVFYKFLLFI
jgi:hypothetical protein